MPDIQNNFAILVVSCDKYSDLWNPFFESFLDFGQIVHLIFIFLVIINMLMCQR